MNYEKVVLSDSVTIYRGDCKEILPTLAPVDAVVTDPPYGIGFAAMPTNCQRRAGKKPEEWDNRTVQNIHAVVAAGKVAAVWGGNYYELPPSRGWLTWFKPDAPPSMASLEFCWTNLDQNARQISCSIAATNAERVGHPTQKPLRVMTWTMQQTRLSAESTVLDPFMGSGTTGVACIRTGRKFIGIEIDPVHFETARRRLERELAQPMLPMTGINSGSDFQQQELCASAPLREV